MKTCTTPGCENESARASKYGQCPTCAAARRKAFNVEAQRIRRAVASGAIEPAAPRKCACGCDRDLRAGAHYRFATAACRHKAKNARERQDRKASQPVPKSQENRPYFGRKDRWMPDAFTGPRVGPTAESIANPSNIQATRIESTWPDWRKVNADDIDPAKAKFIDGIVCQK